jgi:hypothetical protein
MNDEIQQVTPEESLTILAERQKNRIIELEQQIAELQAKNQEIIRRAVNTICLCDKHTDISFEDFLVQHHCPLCCYAEAKEKDKSIQVLATSRTYKELDHEPEHSLYNS